MKLLQTIDTQAGIYDTHATIIRHKNGHVTVKVPFVRWDNNTGSLAFEKRVFTGDNADLVSRLFSESPPEYATLNEFLSYNPGDQ